MSQEDKRRGDKRGYQSYLLRLWRVDEGENDVQASLESTHTGERHGFANFGAMLDFLRRQMAAQAESSGDREERG